MKKTHRNGLIVITLFLLPLELWTLYVTPPSTGDGSFDYDPAAPFFDKTEKRIIVSDVDPQVIYRVDDHRYLTLENYISCDQAGEVYYHDSRKGIKIHVSGDNWAGNKNTKVPLLGYQGSIINAAANGDIVFPYAPSEYCTDSGCRVGVMVLNHNNNKFYSHHYAKAYEFPQQPIKTWIAVVEGFFYVDNYYPKIKYSTTPGSSFFESVSTTPANLRTPSGDTHYYCDNQINPRSVKFIYPETGREEQ